MNPFDAVGTARVSQAIADRMCRIAIGYQDAPGERRIVTTVTGVDGALPAAAVELTRLTREHAQVRMGVLGARRDRPRAPGDGLAQLRGERRAGARRRDASPTPRSPPSPDGCALEEGCERTPEEIVLELIERLEPRRRRAEARRRRGASAGKSRAPERAPARRPAPPGTP